MVEMKSSYLDSASLSSDEHAPLVQADPLTTPSPSAPPSYHDASLFVHVRGEAIPPVGDDDSNNNNDASPPTATTTDQEDEDRAAVTAAGVGSGIFGLILGGPILGIVFGFGGAYAAEHKRGQLVGDTARAIGHVARVVQAQAVAVDAKHKVVDKSKVAARQAWRKAQQVDREHRILEKAKDATVYSWKATVAYVQKHNLVERGVNTIGSGFCWIIDKVTPSSSGAAADNQRQQQEQQQNNSNLTAAATGVRPMPPPTSRS